MRWQLLSQKFPQETQKYQNTACICCHSQSTHCCLNPLRITGEKDRKAAFASSPVGWYAWTSEDKLLWEETEHISHLLVHKVWGDVSIELGLIQRLASSWLHGFSITETSQRLDKLCTKVGIGVLEALCREWFVGNKLTKKEELKRSSSYYRAMTKSTWIQFS